MMNHEKQSVIRMAATSSKEFEAAQAVIGAIQPFCIAMDGKGLYDANQMEEAFLAGRQWLIERIYQAIPLDTLTLEGAFRLLNDFIRAIPKGWTIEQAIEHLKNL